MSFLEWGFIGGMSGAILSFLGGLYQLVEYVLKSRKLNSLPVDHFKNKHKKRKILSLRKKLTLQKKKYLTRLVIFLVVGIGLTGGSLFISHYQAMNLTSDDSETVVKGYYLLTDFQKQLDLAKNKKDERDKVQKNIRYLATIMASYGTKSADSMNSEEGQTKLNRYFQGISQLGVNVSAQTENFYGNQKLTDEYLSDIKKVEGYQKSVFTYYKVKEDAFLKEK